MTTTLHERIRFRIDVLSAIATAATPGPWEYATVRGVTSVGAPGVLPSVAADVHFDADVHYLVAFSPAVTLPWLAGELEVLERHRPVGAVDPICAACSDLDLGQCRIDDCPEIRSLASRLGVSVDG
jgi:hypothetical protein